MLLLNPSTNSVLPVMPTFGQWKEVPLEQSFFTWIHRRIFTAANPKNQIADVLKLEPERRISLILSMLDQVDYLLPELKIVVASLSIVEKLALLTRSAMITLETGKPETFRQTAKLFTLDELEFLVKANLQDVAQKISTLFPEQEKTTLETSPERQTFVETGLKLLNAVRAAFNLLEAAKEPDTYYEGTYLLDIFCKLILIPVTIVTFLNLFFPVVISMTIAASFLISLYFSLQFLPTKIILPDFCQDLTEMAKQGKIKRINGREEESKKLVSALLSRSDARPTLTGESRIGKTSIAHNLAIDIEAGKIPELAGKRVIWVNTVKLLPPDGTNFKIKKPMTKLIDCLGKEINNTIVFFDELQGALLKEGAFAQELKTDLPPLYFGACTTKDFAEINKDEGLRTRFGFPIQIQTLSMETTCRLLAQEAIENAPELEFNYSFFEAIYEKTKAFPQPQASRDLFGRILVDIRASGGNASNLKIISSLESQIEKALAACLNQQDVDYLRSEAANELAENIRSLRHQIDQEKDTIQERKKYLKLFGKFRRVRFESMQLSSQLSNRLQLEDNEEQKRELLFRVFFLEPELKKKLELLKLGNNLCNQFQASINFPGLND